MVQGPGVATTGTRAAADEGGEDRSGGSREAAAPNGNAIASRRRAAVTQGDRGHFQRTTEEGRCVTRDETCYACRLHMKIEK